MIRPILCAGICFFTLMSSKELHRQKQNEAETVREMSEVLGRAEAMIGFEAADVFTVCRRAFEGVKYFDAVPFEKIYGGDFYARWQSACEGLEVDAEAKRLFSSAGEVMGSCGAPEQCERLKAVSGELSKRYSALKEKSEASRKLYLTLGLLFGAAISVIFV